MSPTELTALIAGLTALVGTPGFVAYVKRRRAPNAVDVARMYREECDRLEKKITELQSTSAKALAEAEARWQKQHEADQAQIITLRQEVDTLYRRIYAQPS